MSKDNSKLEREELFWHYPHYHGSGWTPGAAIRQGDWKLIEFYETETIELYNLSVDISEAHNLAEKYPKRTKKLLDRLHEFQANMNANTILKNKNYN